MDIDDEADSTNIRDESRNMSFSQIKDLEFTKRESLIFNFESSNPLLIPRSLQASWREVDKISNE